MYSQIISKATKLREKSITAKKHALCTECCAAGGMIDAQLRIQLLCRIFIVMHQNVVCFLDFPGYLL